MRALLIINATLDKTLAQDIGLGRSPRKDYLQLQAMLDADMIDLGVLTRRRWTRLARRVLGASAAQALLAWSVSGRYDVLFADRESVGFALAALSRLRRCRPRLVMIGHLLSSGKKQRLARAMRLAASIDQVVVHSSLQARIAQEALGFRADQTALMPYQCDDRFWASAEAPPKRQICSVGLEYRDYATLIESVAGLDLQVTIGAASHWSKHPGLAEAHLPPNVQVASYDYAALCRLYAESLFVVVPLLETDNQAGITTILEAMAMGKAVIVSHTRGQTDVVRDRRGVSRFDPLRSCRSEWARTLGAGESTVEGSTGIYVKPGDPAELQRAIIYLVEHPEVARAMGANGRRLVEETMGLELYTERLASLMRRQSIVKGEEINPGVSHAVPSKQ